MLFASSTTVGAETGHRTLFAAAENRLMPIKIERMKLEQDGIASPIIIVDLRLSHRNASDPRRSSGQLLISRVTGRLVFGRFNLSGLGVNRDLASQAPLR